MFDFCFDKILDILIYLNWANWITIFDLGSYGSICTAPVCSNCFALSFVQFFQIPLKIEWIFEITIEFQFDIMTRRFHEKLGETKISIEKVSNWTTRKVLNVYNIEVHLSIETITGWVRPLLVNELSTCVFSAWQCITHVNWCAI